jgi:tyrosyl-tRNA synthetase
MKTFKLQTKIKDEVMKFNNFSDQYIKSILESSERAVRKNKELKTVDLNKQEKNLEERIMLKKVRSQEKLKILSPRKIRLESG